MPLNRKGKIFVVAVSAALLLLFAAFAALFVHVLTVKRFFNLYVTGIMIGYITSPIFHLARRNSILGIDTWRPLRRLNEEPFVPRIRGWLHHILSFSAKTLVWPETFIFLARLPFIIWIKKDQLNPRAAKFYGEDHKSSFDVPLARLLLAVCIYLAVKPSAAYAIELAAVPIIAVACWHSALILSSDNFVTQLKQTDGSPSIKLAIFVGIDLTTLTLCLSLIGRALSPHYAQANQLQQIATQLIKAPRTGSQLASLGLANVWPQFLHLGALDKLTLLCGLLMYSAMLRTIISDGMNSMRRTDSDYEALAERYAYTGNFKLSLMIIDKVKINTWHSDLIKGQALLMEGDIDRAKAAVVRSLRNNPSVFVDPTNDDVYDCLFSCWRLISTDVRERLVADSRRHNLSESVRHWFNIFVRDINTIELPSRKTPLPVFDTVIGRVRSLIETKQFDAVAPELETFLPRNPSDSFLKAGCELDLQVAVHHEKDASEADRFIEAWLQSDRDQFEVLCTEFFPLQPWTQFLFFTEIKRLRSILVRPTNDADEWLSKIRAAGIAALETKSSGKDLAYVFKYVKGT
jgi:hypothetical protein